jgi:SAM-dependent methyltransferase
MPLAETMSVPRTWNLVAPGYAVEIVPMFSRFAADALALARLAPGERALDVATGPGTLALAAARAGARVSAIDFSPQMVDELRARMRREGITGVDARVADARALPYDEGTFDAVFSMFAMNLIADRATAFREIHRVLRRGGRAVVGTPTSPKAAPAYPAICEVVRRTLPDLDLDFDLPLTEPADLRREMSVAGFSGVDVGQAKQSFEYRSVGVLWAVAGRAAAPVVLARERMTEESWSRASEEIVRGLEQRFGAGPLTIELTVNLAKALK